MGQTLERIAAAKGEVPCIALFSPELIEAYWPEIVRQMRLIPHVWSRWWTIEALYEAAMRGTVQIWGVGTKDQVHVIVFTRLASYPTGLILQAFLAFGNRLIRYLPLLVATITKFALDQGCHTIEVTGRAGWGRVLDRYGFRFKSVTVQLDLQMERIH
jgi:hypothetical protein